MPSIWCTFAWCSCTFPSGSRSWTHWWPRSTRAAGCWWKREITSLSSHGHRAVPRGDASGHLRHDPGGSSARLGPPPSGVVAPSRADRHGTDCEVPLFEGGSPGADWRRVTVSQLWEQGRIAGITAGQLAEWNTLLSQPGRWFPGLAMVAAWGRRP
jgi:hypothetical protein